MSDKRSQNESRGSGKKSAGEGDKPARRKPAAKAKAGAAKAKAGAAKATRAAKTPAKSKTSPAKPATSKTAPVEPQAAAGKTPTPAAESSAAKLPAYGLAADILQTGGRSAEDTGAFDVRINDPERVFSFADRLAAHTETDAAPETPVRISTWVTVSLSGEVFALPVEPVREVLRVTSITRVPHAPAPIRGVSNVRGRVIPVIDLRLRIGLEAADLDRSSRVVVVRSRGRRLGLLVDAVHQVVHLDLNQAQPPPEDVMTVQSDYISGVYHLGDQLVLLLDVERALLIREPGEDGDEDDPDRGPPAPEADRSSAQRSEESHP